MTIQRDAVSQRLAQLQAQRDRLLADVNATVGAIQDCEHWLAVLDASEPPANPPSAADTINPTGDSQ